MNGFIILGNQLFPLSELQAFKNFPIFMKEDHKLCTLYKIHKQKLILFLSAMRHYEKALSSDGFKVIYEEYERFGSLPYEKRLLHFIKTQRITTLHAFEIEDHFFSDLLTEFLNQHQVHLKIHPSPMFLTSKEEFRFYLASVKKPFMKTFYESRRKSLNILMEGTKPHKGKMSFDQENRKKLPKSHTPSPLKAESLSPLTKEVVALVEDQFKDHPGLSQPFLWPVTRKEALSELQHFINHRLGNFGDYQDALSTKDPFVYHSLLSPALNLGLITPKEVVGAVVAAYQKKSLPINSVEGFIRQVIGWREFVRGIYHQFDKQMSSTNFFSHDRAMSKQWYEGGFGIEPLDLAIDKVRRYGYAHHIERLMVLANFMNLCELSPREVYGWFMEMFVDSSDWVMAANVYGMGLMSDGGIFATKPYISGSNYLLKMGDYQKGPWCEIWDGLYWRFIGKHAGFFRKNPRLGMMVSMFEKMPKEKKDRLLQVSEDFLNRFCPLPREEA